MINSPEDEGLIRAITRMAKETKAPIKNSLLKIIGIAQHDIIVRLKKDFARI